MCVIYTHTLHNSISGLKLPIHCICIICISLFQNKKYILILYFYILTITVLSTKPCHLYRICYFMDYVIWLRYIVQCTYIHVQSNHFNYRGAKEWLITKNCIRNFCFVITLFLLVCFGYNNMIRKHSVTARYIIPYHVHYSVYI